MIAKGRYRAVQQVRLAWREAMTDDVSEIQRRIAAANERRGRTLHGYAQGSLDDTSGGRYGVLPKPSVIGATATIGYPQQPAGSPWKNDPVGQEPTIDRSEDGLALGYAIDGPGDAANTDLGRVATDARATGIKLRRRI